MLHRARILTCLCLSFAGIAGCEGALSDVQNGDADSELGPTDPSAPAADEDALPTAGDDLGESGDALTLWDWWLRRDAGVKSDAAVADAGSAQTDAGTVKVDAGTVKVDAGTTPAPVDAGTSTPTPVDAGSTPPPPPPPPSGSCTTPAPAEAQLEDVSRPTTVVGTGTPASCTSAAFVAAVANGGVITFNCGPNPVTITLTQTAKVFNNKGPKVVIDGGGKVTLSGGGARRILYMNTCDQAQVWTTANCDNQEFPQLTVQNLTFVDGNAKAEGQSLTGGGGAIYVQGGRFKVINSQFYNNVCPDVGPDVGGGAIRTLMQYNNLPVHIVNSTFGAEGRGNVCSNGGGLSSIGVSYNVVNSTFTANKAIGTGANPARSGTPGGGNGGAIYNDGHTYTLTLCGVRMENNTSNREGGGGVFFVSNDRTGSMFIKDSTLQNNTGGSFDNYPGMFVLAKSPPSIVNSVVR